VLNALRVPIALDNGEVVVTATGGIAFFPLDADSVDTLLHHADIALSLTQSALVLERGRIVLLCVARGLTYLHSERVCLRLTLV